MPLGRWGVSPWAPQKWTNATNPLPPHGWDSRSVPSKIVTHRPRRTRFTKNLKMKVNTQEEQKFFDGSVVVAGIPIAGQIVDSINLVRQGIGEQQRIGRRLLIKSLSFRITLTLNSTAGTATQDTVRIVTYLDKQANGSAPTVGTLLQTAVRESFNNLSNKNRFTTISDIVLPLNSIAHDGVASLFMTTYQAVYKKSIDIPIEFNADVGLISDIASNNIGIMLISDAGRATATYNWRIRYTG